MISKPDERFVELPVETELSPESERMGTFDPMDRKSPIKGPPREVHKMIADTPTVEDEPEDTSEVGEEELEEEEVEAPKPASKKSEPSAEEQAKALGWKPKDKFKGGDRDWISAEEYIENGKKYSENRKKIEEQKRMIETLADTLNKVEARSYKKALAEIQAQKDEAFSRGDKQTYTQLEQNTHQLNNDFSNAARQTANASPQDVMQYPVMQVYMRQNESWAMGQSPRDRILQAEAKSFCDEYERIHPSSILTEDYVRDEVAYMDAQMLSRGYGTFMGRKESTESKVSKVASVTGGRSDSKTSKSVSVPADFDQAISKLDDASKMVAKGMKNNRMDWKSYVKHCYSLKS